MATWLRPGLKQGISTWQGGKGAKLGTGSRDQLPDPTWIARGAGKEGWTWVEDGLPLTQIQGEVQLPSAKLEFLEALGAALPLWQKAGIHLPGLLLLCLSCCVKAPVW